MQIDGGKDRKGAAPLSDKLRRIRDAFIHQLPEQLAAIRTAYSALAQNTEGAAAVEDLHRRLHTLRGGSASFGLSTLAVLAGEGEKTARQALREGEGHDPGWQRRMQDHLARLQQEADRIELTGSAGFQPQEIIPLSKTGREETRQNPLVYVCEDDEHLCITLAAQLRCFGFEVVAFGDPADLRQAIPATPPDAVVMDIVFPDRPLGGTEVMHELRAGGLKIPTVFISGRDDLGARLAAVRAGADGYFVKPLNMADFCTKLSALLRVEKTEPYQVLIIDDDPQLAAYHAEILERAGMRTRAVTDPLASLAALADFRPDLILMDMYMPGCSGTELAKVIRQINAFVGIPIVYLSTEIDSDKQFDAIYMGGDEFLTKPIKPAHLISSVAIRAERMKLMRAQMVHDSMTGLYNHTACKEHLELAVGTARRQQSALCFAMLDLDFFKSINDNYGHPVGDQVLITLARLLKQRLRTTDIIGRFGGEEFAVILPGCESATAVKILTDLSESFAAVEFQEAGRAFSATFSCGVASMADCASGAALCKTADEALYQAKRAGRNRVVAWQAADEEQGP